jgi:hypothetical protein
MGKDFKISSEYQGYVFVGWAEGNFENDRGDKQPYFNMYVLGPVSTWESDDYQASGFKAEKKKCSSADIWKDLVPGDRVKLFFDDKKRVVMAALDQ